MKKLLLILLCLPMIGLASFPISFNYDDPAEEVWGILGGVLQIIGVLIGSYYFYKAYKNTVNPWIKFLCLSGLIVLALFLLLGILCGITGSCQ